MALANCSLVNSKMLDIRVGSDMNYPQELCSLPLPMCLRVCSIVELRLTLESRPRQKRFLLLDGSVKPSTKTLRAEAWKVSPTLLLSS